MALTGRQLLPVNLLNSELFRNELIFVKNKIYLKYFFFIKLKTYSRLGVPKTIF